MAWKIESWQRDLLPLHPDDVTKLHRQFDGVSDSEMATQCGAILDAALAEILAGRLNGSEAEINEFLGSDGNAQAPLKSFGARIEEL